MTNNTRAYIWIILASLILGTLGCSETTKEAEPLPDLIQSVKFPYINNNTLSSFNPETGELITLDTYNNNLILALDTDKSKKKTDNTTTISFDHTTTPEFFVYAKEQSLHIFDLENNKSHKIYSFANEKVFDPNTNQISKATNSFICDIQKVVIWDDEAKTARKELFKDELSVFVKTSLNENCSDNPDSYNYWKINIVEDKDEYTLRRKVLLEHTHKHQHFHDHDDENYEYADLHKHVHILKADEKDENGQNFDPNNHTHSHTHTHDFVYGHEHQHDFLSKEEVDEIHDNPKYHEIKYETYPKLIGKKTTLVSIDEALMYSGKPVIDKTNRRFGYLGFNTSESSYKFFMVNPESEEFRYTELWELHNENFDINNDFSLTNLERLSNKDNRLQNFDYIDSNIWITANNKIYYFTLEEIFDDDKIEEREYRIEHPLFTSSIMEPSLSNRAKYNEENKSFLITEGLDVWRVDLTKGPISEPHLVRRHIESTLQSIDTYDLSGKIAIQKHFIENSETQTSLVLTENDGLENLTVIPKTQFQINTLSLKNTLLFNSIENNSEYKFADYYILGSSSTTRLNESVWGLDAIDYRELTEESVITLLTSETTPAFFGSIASPILYLFDLDESLGQGEAFGYIPEDLTSANKIIFLNEMYGIINITNIEGEEKDYFFSNLKSSFNFDNEYKVMKLLSPETSE